MWCTTSVPPDPRDHRPARRRIELGLAEGGADVEGGGRHACGFERVIGEARAFADAAHGRIQAGDGNGESAARRAVGQRSNKPADATQNLRPRRLRQALPQPPQRVAARRLAAGFVALESGRSAPARAERDNGCKGACIADPYGEQGEITANCSDVVLTKW